MFKAGYAQEIITPPVGVGLAGYFNKRPNEGMYDDLYVKSVVLESKGKKFAFITFDLCSIGKKLFEELENRITDRFGREFYESTIISATHTHTGPELRKEEEMDERTQYAFRQAADGAMRALERAYMNLLPAELHAGSVCNNPYGFVRRYFMKSGIVITNPGWRNPEIDKPETDYDHIINILAVKQGGRIVSLLCNIANHGDTVGGSIVSADWYGRFTQEIQYNLKESIPVLVLDDASGDINHFDFRQKIQQTSYKEATRIGKGYAAIVLDALNLLTPLTEEDVVVKNTVVTIPHRVISPEELAEAKYLLETVPDIKKEGDLESQDLANKVPAAVRYFAQRVIDCHEKSTPSHTGRMTSIRLGNDLVFVTLPGEPFSGISQAIREKSPCKYTFVVELAQSVSSYVPMPECFERGGYEVQPGVNTVAPNAANALIEGAISIL